VEAAVNEKDPGLRALKIESLQSLVRDAGDARVALPRLAAFVKDKRRRQPGDACTPASDAIPGDVQAAITVMTLAARSSSFPLLLDSLDLTGANPGGYEIAGAG
jgi:hypothetical protein